jgi:thioesterase domain-containing protein
VAVDHRESSTKLSIGGLVAAEVAQLERAQLQRTGQTVSLIGMIR